MSDRTDFLLEASRTSHEELMFRVKHRDDWMKLQLIAQCALAALAFGIEIGGVKRSAPLPWTLTLASPVSFVLAVLYCVEDRLVGLLSHWRAGLPNAEAGLQDAVSSQTKIEVFESSAAIKEYAHDALWLRLTAQLCAFIAVPAILAAYRIYTAQFNAAEFSVCSISLALTLAVLIHQFRARRTQVRKATA